MLCLVQLGSKGPGERGVHEPYAWLGSNRRPQGSCQDKPLLVRAALDCGFSLPYFTSGRLIEMHIAPPEIAVLLFRGRS
jgi:hypothetical protein